MNAQGLILRAAASIVLVVTLAACAGTGVQIPDEPPGSVYEAKDLYDSLAPKDRFMPTMGEDVTCQLDAESGRTLLAYSVGAGGRPERISIVESGGSAIDGCGYAFVGKLKFKWPGEWAATGGPARRYRFGLIVEVVGKPKVAPFEPKVTTAVVTRMRIRRCAEGGQGGLPPGVCKEP